jgi:hypothetical protein
MLPILSPFRHPKFRACVEFLRPGTDRRQRYHAKAAELQVGARQPEHAPGPGTRAPLSGYAHRSLAPIPVRYTSVDTAI